MNHIELKQLRESKAYTQAEFCVLVGKSLSAYCKIEQGLGKKGVPKSVEMLARLQKNNPAIL